ncbi:hypothetical protein AGLY_004881 [Aphis glycines]|uniref:Uncharacterized protein n=1 Tax=Aphis glycines TaxID=307491 RepID=A0A6G0TXF8_APHGL|nr:hypothetical protein AGLY_004881 [Aphis glycines]
MCTMYKINNIYQYIENVVTNKLDALKRIQYSMANSEQLLGDCKLTTDAVSKLVPSLADRDLDDCVRTLVSEDEDACGVTVGAGCLDVIIRFNTPNCAWHVDINVITYLSCTSAFEVSWDKCSLESCSSICALGIIFQLSILACVLSSFHNKASSDSLTPLSPTALPPSIHLGLSILNNIPDGGGERFWIGVNGLYKDFSRPQYSYQSELLHYVL